MTGRERFLTVLDNKKPDRMPVQVHNFMSYYLKHYLHGMSDCEAYDFFGMDPVLYRQPTPIYSPRALENWVEECKYGPEEADGSRTFVCTITTPEGVLRREGKRTPVTTYTTRHWIQCERDFDIWNKYVPLPDSFDWTPVLEAKRWVGDRGIVRGGLFDFGQGSPWQSLTADLMDVQEAIYLAFDEPERLHYMLECMLQKKLKAIDHMDKIENDLIECGGGSGSSTVISPDMHREFCLPYDQRQHKAIHEHGAKIVYHLCGGLMPLLEIVAENGADGLETMTPVSMGGDCDIEEAARRVGDKLFFIGGFDQNAGFENGTVENVREQVQRLFRARPNGGYICCPSDHFFHGDPKLVQAFVDAARACVYD